MTCKRPELLLIDFDGVLADISSARRLQVLACLLDCEPASIQSALHRLSSTTGGAIGRDDLPLLCDRLGDQLGKPVSVAHWLQARLEATSIRRDCRALLAQVTHTAAIAVLTNNPAGMATPIAERLDLPGLQGRVLTSGALGLRKPDPACYLAALQQLQATPARTLFIDNLFANVQGARTAGLMADTAHHGQSLRRVLKRFHLLR